MLDGLLGVPEPLGGIFELLDQNDVVEPGNFCRSLRQIRRAVI